MNNPNYINGATEKTYRKSVQTDTIEIHCFHTGNTIFITGVDDLPEEGHNTEKCAIEGLIQSDGGLYDYCKVGSVMAQWVVDRSC